MKRIAKTIGITAILCILLCGAYILGTTQREAKEIETYVHVIPAGYIDTTDGRFYDNYLDMRTVKSYCGTPDGLQLYTSDGGGYYLNIPMELR